MNTIEQLKERMLSGPFAVSYAGIELGIVLAAEYGYQLNRRERAVENRRRKKKRKQMQKQRQ